MLALPANFAEETDSRYAAYVEQYGEECCELDALSPTVIVDLIRTKIEAMIDVAKWRKEAAEQHNRELLDRVSKNWPKVQWCARIVALGGRSSARVVISTSSFAPEQPVAESVGIAATRRAGRCGSTPSQMGSNQLRTLPVAG
jgi:hypothetical protein